MPAYTARGEIARRNAAQNPFSRWHRKDASPDELDGKLAFQRLQSQFLTPLIQPDFKVRRSDKLFAIGSCFARGIEGALLGRKFDVVSAAPEFASLATIGPQVTGLGFTNRYNTYSIANELGWALDPSAEFPEASIVDLKRRAGLRSSHQSDTSTGGSSRNLTSAQHPTGGQRTRR